MYVTVQEDVTILYIISGRKLSFGKIRNLVNIGAVATEYKIQLKQCAKGQNKSFMEYNDKQKPIIRSKFG